MVYVFENINEEIFVSKFKPKSNIIGGGERVLTRGLHHIFSITVPKYPKIKNVCTAFFALFAGPTTRDDSRLIYLKKN